MINNDKKVVGKRIHKVRKALKMNQSEFGKKINVTQKSVSEMENGISTPSFETLKKMLLGYNVNIIWVINGNGNMFLNRVEAEGNKKESIEDIMRQNNELLKNLITLLSNKF